MKKVVFLTIAALFMFGCTKTSECYVEKAETLTDVKSGCRSLTEISEIAQKAAMNFISDGTKSNIAVKIASIIPYNEALTKSSYRAQNETYMCRSAKNAVIGLCFSVLSAA